jgi:GT2 family glycosyltransferase
VIENLQVLSVIVLNWRKPYETLACLESLEQLDYLNTEIIVVDNGSRDDSVPLLHQYFPGVHILETDSNLGYAGGNNAGIRHALAHGAERVLILNNDVTVEPGFLAPLLAALQSQPDIGVVTPLVAEQASGGRVWALGSVVNWHTAEVRRQNAGEAVEAWRHRAPVEVEIASGAAMLVKAEVFQQVGLLDEDFFLYFEEIDWCLRVRQAGYRVVAVPASVVWHKVSAALGTASPVVDYYMLRNHLRLIRRHWSWARRAFLEARITLGNVLTIAVYTAKPHCGQRTPSRNARLMALRDAARGCWGEMGPDVAKVCNPSR